jgi:hypothetical protein
MNSLLIFIAGIVLIGLLAAKAAPTSPVKTDRRSEVSYGVFILLLAASPIVGGLFVSAVGIRFSPRAALCFSWVGMVASLPMALLVSRMLGGSGQAGFWNYLESSSRWKTSKRRIVAFWAIISGAAFVIGVFGFMLSERAAGAQ